MSAIDYFTATYGEHPWVDLTLNWAGTADEFRVYDVSDPVALYTGSLLTLDFIGEPSHRYDFRLEADVGAVTSSAIITVFTRTLPAPVALSVSSITENSALLSWNTVGDADSYEIADVADNYTVIASTINAYHPLAGLDPLSRYSYSVRTILNGLPSKWSAPVTFTTIAASTVASGVYTYPPTGIHCWMAGRPGSSDPEWRPEANDWYHGDGFQWGDASGINSTFFFFGPANPFGALAGGTPSKIEVYLDRASYGGDPGVVLSRWTLHDHATKPVSDPVLSATQSDTGSYPRGQYGWLELPLGWAATLIAGTDRGLAWGGVEERFQVMKNVPVGTDPRPGTVRITVA